MARREDLRAWHRSPGNVSPRQLLGAALQRGWIISRQSGSHVILTRPGFPLILSIPLGTKANATKRGIIEILMEANDDDDDG